jgi:hypothetical protein
MSHSSSLVVTSPRIIANAARIGPFKDFAGRGLAIDPEAPPHAALTSATESVHGDKFSQFARYLDFCARLRGSSSNPRCI